VRVLAILACALLLPTVGAHGPGCGDSRVHVYVSTPLVASRGVDAFAAPGCPSGSDPAYGTGGAFLPAAHHGDLICVADSVVAHVSFSIGRDLDGDGVISPGSGDQVAGPFDATSCAKAPWEAGVDGGWWIILGSEATQGTISA